MSKIKLQRFELLALLEDSKKLTDFLQHYGVVHIENIDKNFGADISFQKNHRKTSPETMNEIY